MTKRLYEKIRAGSGRKFMNEVSPDGRWRGYGYRIVPPKTKEEWKAMRSRTFYGPFKVSNKARHKKRTIRHSPVVRSAPNWEISPAQVSRSARSTGASPIPHWQHPRWDYDSMALTRNRRYTQEVKKLAKGRTNRLKPVSHGKSYEHFNLTTGPYLPLRPLFKGPPGKRKYMQFSELPYDTRFLLYPGAFNKNGQSRSYQTIKPRAKRKSIDEWWYDSNDSNKPNR